jgi:hypothetical protein
VLISVLFTGMIKHGYIPSDMLGCTVMPIPKNTKSPLISQLIIEA